MIVENQRIVLASAAWRERADAHLARARRHTLPARRRRERGLPHPTADFLFTYIDAVVESRPVCCSHYDAFRFFAAEARPRNALQPTLESRIMLEQPACLHANMDLYKWAAKAMPWTGSELLLDCFELAVDLRDLDMRASPYDLSGWGRAAVPVETPAGRRQYEAEQKALAARAVPLRQRLIDVLRATLDAAGPRSH